MRCSSTGIPSRMALVLLLALRNDHRHFVAGGRFGHRQPDSRTDLDISPSCLLRAEIQRRAMPFGRLCSATAGMEDDRRHDATARWVMVKDASLVFPKQRLTGFRLRVMVRLRSGDSPSLPTSILTERQSWRLGTIPGNWTDIGRSLTNTLNHRARWG